MPVPHGRAFRASLALDPWAWKLQGQGPGSVTGGENAYAGIVGPIPSEIVWAGFHGTYSPLVVTQNLITPMWSQLMRVKITGSWKRIFDHFSAAASARYLWFSADVKAEFNQLRINGDIQVELDLDGTRPGGQELERSINQRIDQIVQVFTDQAKKVIFDPPMPNVEPAQNPSGGLFSGLFGGSGGLALKMRHDATYVDLKYEETRYFRYNQPHTISSSLEGFYNEIKQDKDAERKYFQRLILGGLGRKVMRIVKPVVNWPDKTKDWAGEPVAFLSAQVGYPGQQGQIQWKAATFQPSDAADATFRPAFIELRKDEIQNPPAKWEPDCTYVKRNIHLLEPPGENEYPFTKVYVEKNVISLDPEPNGSLGNDNILEVRADRAGVLDVGPVSLAAELQSNSEVVEVEFRALGKRADGTDRAQSSTRFRWTFADQNEPRLWKIFTGQHDFAPAYQHRAHVTVKGTIFSKGQAWSGPWVDGGGNGALMVDVPPPDGPGVVTRSLTSREIFADAVVRAVDGWEGEEVAPAPPAPASPESGVPPVPGPPEAAPGAGPGGPPPPPSAGAPAPPREAEQPGSKAAAGTVRGYRIEPEPASAKSGAGTRKMKSVRAADTEDPEGWVEVPAGQEGQAPSAPSRSSSGTRARTRATPQTAEEDPGGWVEVPPGETESGS